MARLTRRLAIQKTYTSAPVAYNGFGTRTLIEEVDFDGLGNVIRLVETPDEHVQWQRGRYESGMHLTADEATWATLKKYYVFTGGRIFSFREAIKKFLDGRANRSHT